MEIGANSTYYSVRGVPPTIIKILFTKNSNTPTSTSAQDDPKIYTQGQARHDADKP